MLTYKGFVAQIEYEPDSDIILGEVINSQDVLMFEGRNLNELKQRFSETVDDYLELTKKIQFTEIMPFIGRFTICLAPDEQQKMFKAAERESMGVQHWLNREVQYLLSKLHT